MKLLIVEENEAMCRLVRALTEGLPIAVSECHDGAQVLAVCADVQPDWVLIDLNLAGMDAFVATRRITTTYPRSRVLLLSEDDDARLRYIAAGAGVWAVVLKENLIEVRRFLEPSAEDAAHTDPERCGEDKLQ
ncbi:MAG TPA: response regulator [Bryobacteraceae bacterium]|nr:response regulator [Bryobacteraceae bacterium]